MHFKAFKCVERGMINVQCMGLYENHKRIWHTVCSTILPFSFYSSALVTCVSEAPIFLSTYQIIWITFVNKDIIYSTYSFVCSQELSNAFSPYYFVANSVGK